MLGVRGILYARERAEVLWRCQCQKQFRLVCHLCLKHCDRQARLLGCRSLRERSVNYWGWVMVWNRHRHQRCSLHNSITQHTESYEPRNSYMCLGSILCWANYKKWVAVCLFKCQLNTFLLMGSWALYLSTACCKTQACLIYFAIFRLHSRGENKGAKI